jgi:hypothetical protein
MDKENNFYSTPSSKFDSPSSTTSSPINKESVSDILSMIENIKISQKGNSTPKRYNSFKKSKFTSSPLTSPSISNSSFVSEPDLENYHSDEMKKAQEAQAQKLVKYEKEIEILSSNLSTVVSDRSQMLDRMNVLGTQLEQSQDDLIDSRRQISLLEEKIASMEVQLESRTQLVMSQSNLLTTTKQQVENQNKEFTLQIDKFSNETSHLKSIALELENDVLHLNQELDLKNSELNQFSILLSHEKQQNQELKKSLNESLQNKEIQHLQVEKNQNILTNQIKELEHALSYESRKSTIVQVESEKEKKTIESQLGLVRRCYLEKTLTIQLLNNKLNQVDLEKDVLKKDSSKYKKMNNERNIILKKYTTLVQEHAQLNKMYLEKLDYIAQFEKEYTIETQERALVQEWIRDVLVKMDKVSLQRNVDHNKTYSDRVEQTNKALEGIKLELKETTCDMDLVKLMISNIDNVINYNLVQHDLYLRIQDKDHVYRTWWKQLGWRK